MYAFRIIYSVIFVIALCNISDLTTFYTIWDNALIIFGIHLLILGILVYKSQYIPKYLGIFLVISSLGYLIDGIANLSGINSMVGLLTFIGEILFALWLVIKEKILQFNECLRFIIIFCNLNLKKSPLLTFMQGSF